jgi:hypothetical protein
MKPPTMLKNATVDHASPGGPARRIKSQAKEKIQRPIGKTISLGWMGCSHLKSAYGIHAGRAVSTSIKTRMIGQDLDSGEDDEHHSEEIEKMQQPRPQGEARVHRLRGRGDAGVARDEFLHAGHRAQLLGHCDSEDQENYDQRYRPQDIDRSTTQPDARDHALLRRQLGTLTNTVIGGARACLVVRLWTLARLRGTPPLYEPSSARCEPPLQMHPAPLANQLRSQRR